MSADRRLSPHPDEGSRSATVRATAQLYAIQGFHAIGEAMFAVSLAGSLFFNVSIDASRSRILLYLALTLAPFAILGPSDRAVHRQGPRWAPHRHGARR